MLVLRLPGLAKCHCWNLGPAENQSPGGDSPHVPSRLLRALLELKDFHLLFNNVTVLIAGLVVLFVREQCR